MEETMKIVWSGDREHFTHADTGESVYVDTANLGRHVPQSQSHGSASYKFDDGTYIISCDATGRWTLVEFIDTRGHISGTHHLGKFHPMRAAIEASLNDAASV